MGCGAVQDREGGSKDGVRRDGAAWCGTGGAGQWDAVRCGAGSVAARTGRVASSGCCSGAGRVVCGARCGMGGGDSFLGRVTGCGVCRAEGERWYGAGCGCNPEDGVRCGWWVDGVQHACTAALVCGAGVWHKGPRVWGAAVRRGLCSAGQGGRPRGWGAAQGRGVERW